MFIKICTFFITVATLSSVLTESAQAASRTSNEFAFGLTLGEPSGIHGQFYWSKKSALEVTAAWSFNDWFMTAVDYQVYDYILDSPAEWNWYYGGGAYLALPKNDDGTIGIRIPLGIRYHFPHTSFDIWGEIDPALQLAPDTEAHFMGGLGLTLWLK